MGYMKRYVPIVIGVLALFAVLYVGSDRDKQTEETQESVSSVATTRVTGKAVRQFEGENVFEYEMKIPEMATTSIEKDGSLVKVTEGDVQLLAMYFSFEGGRGYSVNEYITNVIVPHVKAIVHEGTTTRNGQEWTVIASEWSTWHIRSSKNGQWLLVVENKKENADKANAIIDSITDK